MEPSLEALCLELIEEIVTWLDLSDIAALRLTCRVISTKASTRRFISFFKTKTVDLTTESLLRFVEATEEGQLGRLLQHCIIRGIIRGDAPAFTDGDATEHQRLLSKALQNLRQGSLGKSLLSLNIQVAVLVEDSNGDLIMPKEYFNGREVWKTALRTFRVAMAALHESRLPITQHLNIFSDVRGCSLGFDAFLAEFITDSVATREIFGFLKKLTARLSAPPDLGKDEQARGLPQSHIEWQRSHFLQDFLHILPTLGQLESLDLHWYMLPEDSYAEPSVLSSYKQRNTIPGLPHLKDCRLRGVFTSETDLLHFLSDLQPTEVALRYVHLTSGTYTSIFGYLSSQDSQVLNYHLDDLMEDTDLVHFEAPGSLKFNYHLSGPDVGPSTLSREGDQAKEAIEYHFAESRPLGTFERMRWIKFWAQEFGGPNRGRYDFIMLNTEPEPTPLEDYIDGE